MYPALAGDQNLAFPDHAIHVAVSALHGMLAVGRMMTDLQVVDVISYVRTYFGNKYNGIVTVAQVRNVR